MNERVLRLQTVKDCEQFAKNVEAKLPELARGARRRAIELRAADHKAESEAEREALQGVYAYEEVLSAKKSEEDPCVSHLANDQAARNHPGYRTSCK
jgi:hypothetical protein